MWTLSSRVDLVSWIAHDKFARSCCTHTMRLSGQEAKSTVSASAGSLAVRRIHRDCRASRQDERQPRMVVASSPYGHAAVTIPGVWRMG
jgi:hypothetical protein